MKKIFLLVAIVATAFVQNSFAQDKGTKAQTDQLLTLYFNIKDALVSGNASVAATKSAEFVKTANELDANTPSEESRDALINTAGDISKTTDIKKQREYFSGFSDQMFAFAKTTKLSTEPIYKAYCPMKKASWLSKEAAIKNPYYGSAMLTCGKVVETLK
ncbi:DUF3347 domain-containing protein [Daejeonella oryzae]|uniref:DUF3347 domain-containing protein n=1 Tax=Daejeonella oryzae TaxID=1122943 RepID=UPI00041433E6|nr:DUF3347 domain-containing protein [Daejeonella oryzae]